jgi:predicted alpha/beta-fold hydrolase
MKSTLRMHLHHNVPQFVVERGQCRKCLVKIRLSTPTKSLIIHPCRAIPSKTLQLAGNSGLLNIKTAGDATKPAVVFIHGLGGSSLNYEPAIKQAELQDNFYVISFDLRGHGLSPLGPSDSLTFNDYVDSVAAVMQSVNVKKASLVAHSMGGLIATHFAARNPDKVEKLGEYEAP